MESGHNRLSIGDGGQTRECRQDLLQGTRNFTMEVTMMQESGFKPVGGRLYGGDGAVLRVGVAYLLRLCDCLEVNRDGAI
jgi:hypothetical protein